MRNIIFLLIGCAFFASCEKPSPTQIQIVNNRANEKVFNYGLITYFSETGPIHNVEHVRVEHGEMCDVVIYAYRRVTSDEIDRYDLVDKVAVYQIAANSMSEIIEIDRCDRVEILYATYVYNHYYRNSTEIATERIAFDQVEFYDNIKYGKTNKINIYN